jgi:hypothetical protein
MYECLVKRERGAADEFKNGIYHVVISNATMMSSLRIRAVNEIETISRNSFSNRMRDTIMIAVP